MIVWLKSLSLSVAVVAVSVVLVEGASLPVCLMQPFPSTLALPRQGFISSDEELDPSCEVSDAMEWERMPAGSLDLLVSAAGPSGSGRFWQITVGVAQRTERTPSRGLCLTTTTVGWRTLQGYKGKPLPWLNDLDGDGNAELIIWDSFSLYEDADLPAVGLTAWVYRLMSGESLTIDWGLSRRMARDIAEAYRAPFDSLRSPDFVLYRSQAASALQQFGEKRCTIATEGKR